MKTEKTLVPIRQDRILADVGVDISVQCLECNHLGEPLTCKAFTEGIPIEILGGKIDHSKPLPDQGNDIIFEAKEA